jgi:transposase
VARRRRHTKEFKLAALARMEGASDVAALAAELGIDRGLLYKWNVAYRSGGEEGLRLPGERGPRRPTSGVSNESQASPSVSPSRAELERKITQQALELDFFRAALQRFAGRRRPPSGGSGGTGSTP